MKWLVYRPGDLWRNIWPWMDAAIRADLQSRGYVVEPYGERRGE